MFYEVRILDGESKTKKVLSSNFLSKRYWNTFFESAGKGDTPKKSKVKKEDKLGKKIRPIMEV